MVYFRSNPPSSSSEIMDINNDNIIDNTQEAEVKQAAEPQTDEW